jgi:hypothetical protein
VASDGSKDGRYGWRWNSSMSVIAWFRQFSPCSIPLVRSVLLFPRSYLFFCLAQFFLAEE